MNKKYSDIEIKGRIIHSKNQVHATLQSGCVLVTGNWNGHRQNGRTRRYSCGVQRLVSTHQQNQVGGWGGGQRGGIQTNSNPKCQDLSKLSFGKGGGSNSNPKCQDLLNFHLCVCGGGGGGEGGVVVQTNIPEILECGHSRNFTPKIVEA